MIEALIAGQTDPQALAALPRGRIHATKQGGTGGGVARAAEGPSSLYAAASHEPSRCVDAAIASIDKEVGANIANIEPFRVAIEMLTTIPGISSLEAEMMVSEIDIDMSRFKTEGHRTSWAGLCPRNDESAGKRRSNRMKKGAPGSKPHSSNAPARPRVARERTSRHSTCASAPDAAPKRPSALSPLPSSPPPATCSKTAPSIRTLAQNTSATATKASKHYDSLTACRASGSPS